MHRHFHKLFHLGLISLLFCAGCETEHYRWQTVVNEDGSVERTISRPVSGMPKVPEAAEHWQVKRFHKALDRNVWPERMTQQRIESARPEVNKDLKYFIAQGHFDELDQVPQHYLLKLKGTDLASELKHDLTINDYGLVKEYVWMEEVTDVVILEDVPAARREMIKLLSTVVQEGLENGLGDDYDVSELIRWIETEGDQLVEELTLVLLSKELHDLDEPESQKRLDAVAARYGITEMSEEGFNSFVRKRLRAGVKHKGGEPLRPEIIDAILEDPNDEDDGKAQPNKYQQALQAAWEKYVGDKKDEPNRLQILLAKQIGVHGIPLYGPPQEFDVWLKLPGEVIETNGVVDEEGFLKWSFGKDDVWPSGYRMLARSVLPVKVRNSSVLRKAKLGRRDEMLSFLKLMQADSELHETVQECLEQNSLGPLEDLEKLRHDNAGRPGFDQQVKTEEQAQWRRARKLLDLLNQDSPATTN